MTSTSKQRTTTVTFAREQRLRERPQGTAREAARKMTARDLQAAISVDPARQEQA